MDICEYCNNFAYDEEEECYICAANNVSLCFKPLSGVSVFSKWGRI